MVKLGQLYKALCEIPMTPGCGFQIQGSIQEGWALWVFSSSLRGKALFISQALNRCPEVLWGRPQAYLKSSHKPTHVTKVFAKQLLVQQEVPKLSEHLSP